MDRKGCFLFLSAAWRACEEGEGAMRPRRRRRCCAADETFVGHLNSLHQLGELGEDRIGWLPRSATDELRLGLEYAYDAAYQGVGKD